MTYRVCKAFEVESGHMLSKHPGLCRYPHGHSRRIEIVLASEALDSSEMVCDFKAIKLAVGRELDALDHALAINSKDPALERLRGEGDHRLVVFDGLDPTTEVLAKHIHDLIAGCIERGTELIDDAGNAYRFNKGVRVERVRVTETSSSWAEYSPS